MVRKSWVLGLFFVVSLSLFCQKQPEAPLISENADTQSLIFEEEVMKLVNEIRLNHNLKPFILQKELALAARYHAKDMATDDYFDHSTYDRQNGSLVKICGTFERIEKFVTFSYLGENISAGKTTAKETVDGWMGSSGHRTNILNPNFKYMGVGYYYIQESYYKHYWVQDFGG